MTELEVLKNIEEILIGIFCVLCFIAGIVLIK